MSEISQEQPGLSLKDLLIFIPLFGSCLAIAWEIGAFLPVGLAAFSLFTISEHILWALQAFPFALVAAAAIVFTDSSAKIVLERRLQNPGRPGKSVQDVLRNIRWLAIGGAGFSLAGGALTGQVYPFVCSFFFLYFFAGTYAFARLLKPQALSIAGLVIGLLVVAAVGFDMMRASLNRSELAEFKTREGVKRAILVRSGDKGVLLYARDAGTFSFFKWDQITSFDWPRKPLMRF